MDYKKFSEIELMTPALIDHIRECGFDKCDWCVCNKLDGACYQIFIDVDGVMHYGSRNQELGRYDTFNNHMHMVQKYRYDEKVRRLKDVLDDYELLDIAKEGPYELHVFGECIGGLYRHKEVEPVPGAVKIQGRVNYCPDNRWVVFDIFWYQPCTHDGGWLPTTHVNQACEQAGLEHQQVMAVVPFDQAIAYPNDYEDTTGPVLFGLPQITPNVTEGVVLKPGYPYQFNNGSRVIMKNKNKIFLERGVKTNKIKNPPTPMSELDKEWYATYMEFVTESRMMSVLSKMDTSHITQKDFGTLLKAFLDDADKDFNKEYGGTIKELEGSKSLEEFNFMKVLKAAKGQAAQMLRPMFVEFLQKNRMENSDE